jgi:hypothetical protein
MLPVPMVVMPRQMPENGGMDFTFTTPSWFLEFKIFRPHYDFGRMNVRDLACHLGKRQIYKDLALKNAPS